MTKKNYSKYEAKEELVTLSFNHVLLHKKDTKIYQVIFLSLLSWIITRYVILLYFILVDGYIVNSIPREVTILDRCTMYRQLKTIVVDSAHISCHG